MIHVIALGYAALIGVASAAEDVAEDAASAEAEASASSSAQKNEGERPDAPPPDSAKSLAEPSGAAEPVTPEANPATPAAAPPSDAAPSPPEAAPVPPEAAPAEVSDVVANLSAPLVPMNYGVGGLPAVKLGAFADVSVGMVAGRPTPMFQVGQVVIHSTANLGNGLSVFGEATLNSVPTWQARVERLLFHWESSDAFRLTMGRMHLPVTWWNSTYHHGVWLQTSASRPRIIGFDQSFVPNHHKGLMISGRSQWAPDLGLRYQLGVSDGGDDDEPGNGETIPYATAAFGTLAIEPSALPLLRLGVTGYSVWELPLPGQIDGEHTLLAGAHIVHSGQRPELVVEAVRVQHTSAVASGRDAQAASHAAMRTVQSGLALMHADVAEPTDASSSSMAHLEHADGATHTSWGGYAQLGWRPGWGSERWVPYARYELIQLDHMDPTLAELDNQMLVVGGFRVDIATMMAVKLEGSWSPGADVPWASQLQWSAAW